MRRQQIFSITFYFESITEVKRPIKNITTAGIFAMTVLLIKMIQGSLKGLMLSVSEWVTFLLLIFVAVEVVAYIRFQTLHDFVHSHVPHRTPPLVIYDDQSELFEGCRLISPNDPLYFDKVYERENEHPEDEVQMDDETEVAQSCDSEVEYAIVDEPTKYEAESKAKVDTLAPRRRRADRLHVNE